MFYSITILFYLLLQDQLLGYMEIQTKPLFGYSHGRYYKILTTSPRASAACRDCSTLLGEISV